MQRAKQQTKKQTMQWFRCLVSTLLLVAAAWVRLAPRLFERLRLAN